MLGGTTRWAPLALVLGAIPAAGQTSFPFGPNVPEGQTPPSPSTLALVQEVQRPTYVTRTEMLLAIQQALSVAHSEFLLNREQIDANERLAQERTASQFNALKEADKAAAAREEASKEALAAALSAQQLAVDKAATATEKRFDSVNEFRAQLADQSGKFATKDAVDVRFTALDEKIQIVLQQLAKAAAAGEGMSQLWGYILGVVGLIVGVIGALAGISAMRRPPVRERVV